MVTRVTSQAQQANSIQNIFRITEELFKTQQEIATTKRINKPSDDPAGMRDALLLRTGVSQAKQFVKNIDNNRVFISAGDTSLQSINLNLIRAKELAVSALGGASTAKTRRFAASELDQIISQVLQTANKKVKNQFVFSGTNFRTQPFSSETSGAVYFGNSETLKVGIADQTSANFNIPGSQALATDLNPQIISSAALSSLNRGAGITAGSFSISDRAGNTAVIVANPNDTVASLISRINASSVNVTASINSDGNGLQLTDTSKSISQALMVAEVSGGGTAADLGILGKRDGNLSGSNLNPALTASTLVSNLDGGNGLTLNKINIVNGGASGTVTLSSAKTIGDVLNLINNAGLNVTASINSAGNSLQISSNNSKTVAVARNIGVDDTAESLGLGGGRNVFTTLFKLRDALQKNDAPGILASLDSLDSSLESINNSRAVIGASLSRADSSASVHKQDIVDQSKQLSNIEDTDGIKSASDLANLQLALRTTLSASAKIIQPTLLDFLR